MDLVHMYIHMYTLLDKHTKNMIINFHALVELQILESK